MLQVPPAPPSSPPPPPPPVILDTDLVTVVDMSRAKNITPDRVGKTIWYLQDSGRTVKIGSTVKVSEAKALQFIASSAHVPVPEVLGFYEKDGVGHIFMSRIIGKPLGDVLWDLDKDRAQMARVIAQLSDFVRTWMGLRGEYFGSMGSKPCRDVFFQHLPGFGMPNREYGPFGTRKEYCNGLIDALRNARPGGRLELDEELLVERLQRFGDNDGSAVFCHGDLHPDNILVDDQLNVAGIVDMGVSGFSIPEREYFETKSRARHPVWVSMVDQIIPKIPDDSYALLKELELELVRYSGI